MQLELWLDMVLGYEYNLVKVKSVKHESEQVWLIWKRGKDMNVMHDNAMVNTRFIKKYIKLYYKSIKYFKMRVKTLLFKIQVMNWEIITIYFYVLSMQFLSILTIINY